MRRNSQSQSISQEACTQAPVICQQTVSAARSTGHGTGLSIARRTMNRRLCDLVFRPSQLLATTYFSENSDPAIRSAFNVSKMPFSYHKYYPTLLVRKDTQGQFMGFAHVPLLFLVIFLSSEFPNQCILQHVPFIARLLLQQTSLPSHNLPELSGCSVNQIKAHTFALSTLM